MSDMVETIRAATEDVHDDAEGIFKASVIRALLAEVDAARAGRAAAWEQGREAGWDAGARYMWSGEPRHTPNPYYQEETQDG